MICLLVKKCLYLLKILLKTCLWKENLLEISFVIVFCAFLVFLSLSLYCYLYHHHEESNVEPRGGVRNYVRPCLSQHCCFATTTSWPQHPVALKEYTFEETQSPRRNHDIPSRLEQRQPWQCLPSCTCTRAGWRGNRGEEDVQRLKAPQVDPPTSTTTMNTWACAHGGPRGGTYYSELRGNGRTLQRNRGDWDNKRTVYSSLRDFLKLALGAGILTSPLSLQSLEHGARWLVIPSPALRSSQWDVAGFVVVITNLAASLLFACLGILTFSFFFSLSYHYYPISTGNKAYKVVQYLTLFVS